MLNPLKRIIKKLEVKRYLASKVNALFKFILIALVLVYISKFTPEIFFNERREYQLIEWIQSIILLICICLHFQYRKIFISASNLFTYLMRQFFLLIILYEELSFLSFRINKIFFNKNLSLYNHQQEFNFHNALFFQSQLYSFNIPLTDITFTLQLNTFVYVLVLLFISYGSYFRFFNGIKYFFLDRKYSHFTLILIINFILGTLGLTFSDRYDKNLIIGEIAELFIYLLLLLDTIKKRKIMHEIN